VVFHLDEEGGQGGAVASREFISPNQGRHCLDPDRAFIFPVGGKQPRLRRIEERQFDLIGRQN